MVELGLEMSQPLSSLDEFEAFRRGSEELDRLRIEEEASLFRAEEPFTVAGHCRICATEDAIFAVDFSYAWETVNGRRMPNWREHLTCLSCNLNNRMRLALMAMKLLYQPNEPVYLTEQMTPLFSATRKMFPNAIGSEYLRDGTESGSRNDAGIRHEDVTQLSFKDGTLCHIASFDVLEHVPNYQKALAEFARCLSSRGTILISIPFSFNEPRSRIRATISTDGSINHLEPPEYHGDPLDSSGVLCFHNFGWEFLDDLRRAGFNDVYLTLRWSRRDGHLGRGQFLITGVRV